MDKFCIVKSNNGDQHFSDENSIDTSNEWLSSKSVKLSEKATSQPNLVKKSSVTNSLAAPLKRKTSAQGIASTPASTSTKVDADCKKMSKKLWTPSFKKEYEKMALQSFDKEKEISDIKSKGGILRDAEARAKFMHGYDCRCCAPYYDALQLTSAERQKRVNEVSRHRAFMPIPSTPERYWDVKFPNSDVQKDMGVKTESDSPLFKKKARHPKSSKSDVKTPKTCKRRIFGDLLNKS